MKVPRIIKPNKVLIVGVPRSGTTSLMDGFYKQGYYKVSEPYNPKIWIKIKHSYPLKQLEEYPTLVVKTIVGQVHDSWKGDWQSFIVELSKQFDKVILLDRRDNNEHYTSMLNLDYKLYLSRELGEDTHPFKKWREEEIPPMFAIGYKAAGGEDRLLSLKTELNELANKLSTDVDYYEDLYGEDKIMADHTIKEWEIDNIDAQKLLKYLDPSKKLKQTSKKSTI